MFLNIMSNYMQKKKIAICGASDCFLEQLPAEVPQPQGPAWTATEPKRSPLRDPGTTVSMRPLRTRELEA